jgi:hypothetical protein
MTSTMHSSKETSLRYVAKHIGYKSKVILMDWRHWRSHLAIVYPNIQIHIFDHLRFILTFYNVFFISELPD